VLIAPEGLIVSLARFAQRRRREGV
jgi:hypothetical protein